MPPPMSLYTTFVEPVLHNQVVTGLSFTAVLGAIGYQLRAIPGKIETLVHRQAVLTLVVDSRQPAYFWMEQWLSTLSYGQRTTSVVLKARRDAEDDDSIPVRRDGAAVPVPDVYFSPGYGSHWFLWRRRLIWLERKRENVQGTRGGIMETIKLRTYGRSQKLLWDIVQEAKNTIAVSETIELRLWSGGYWNTISGKRLRDLRTVVLQPGQRDRIVADVQKFIAARTWYVDRGIPYRRALLFSGPPGVGKTSLVVALASYLRRPLCSLNFGSLGSDDDLFEAISDAPQSALILIEDIDCAVPAERREDQAKRAADDRTRSQKEKTGSAITQAGLLNALDGVSTPDGRIFILTSNRPDVLDDALLRPGRIDVHERFGLLGVAEQREMARLFYGEVWFPVIGRDLPAAEMQGAFLKYPNDPVKAAELLTEPQQKAA